MSRAPRRSVHSSEARIARSDEAERIIAATRRRRDRGEAVDLERVIAENPRVARELRAGFGALAQLDRLFAPRDADSLVGATIGRRRVTALIGSGGMGDVWLAEDGAERNREDRPQDGPLRPRFMAVKVLRPHLLERPGFLDRFRREAQIGARIRHDNVVATFGLQSALIRGSRLDFLEMEFVEGQTLRGLLSELGRVPEELCRHVGREVAKGLSAIHAAGVVHRDLKPDNVIVTKDHVVKVMDLGVALLADEAARLSQTGAFVGSIHYAAPEQFRKGGRAIDGRADLHALGVLLYEIATGAHPYPSEDFHEAMRRLLQEKPRRASELNPQISIFFEELVHKLLAKDPDERFASADEVALTLADGEDSAWWRGRAWSLRGETKRPLRRIRIPRETALFGRDAEMTLLRRRFALAAKGDGQVVLLEGEAGIGKSRLVDEFVGQLHASGEDVNYLFGSYPPGGAATTSGAFSTAFREHFGDDDAALREALSATPLLVPAFAALLRGDVAPKGSEPLTKDSMQTVFVHATRSLAARRTTIVLVDDLHFAPEEGRALFMSLALAVPGHRVLLVGCARPGLEEKWLGQLAGRPQTTRLAVPRLGPKELVHLLRDALKSERLAEELGVLIAVKSDGNPFFVFEMLRGLKEGQFLAQRPDGTWHTTQVIRDIQVPSSVLDLVKARVADLATAERELLDVAACCGFEFDPSLVAAALGAERVPTLKALAQIERAHRLVRSAGRRFVFDHHQVQEALYGSLPEMLREEYHAAIGAALERMHDASSREPKDVDGAVCVALAEHFLTGAQGARASRYLDAALTHLEAGYLNDAVVRLADRALGMPALVTGQERATLLLRKIARLDWIGRPDEQSQCLDEVDALAVATDDEALQAASGRSRGRHFFRVSRFGDAQAALEEAISLARRCGDRALEASAAGDLGLVFEALGRYEEARAQHERSLSLGRGIGLKSAEANAVGNLGNVFRHLGRIDDARVHLERHLAFSRDIGDRRGESNALGNLGNLMMDIDAHLDAATYLRRQLELSQKVGDRRSEAGATGNLGPVLRELGLHDQARSHSERAIALALELGDRRGEAVFVGHLGGHDLALGRREEARSHFERQRRICREIGYRRGEGIATHNLGLVLVEFALDDDARADFESAIALGREIGDDVGAALGLIEIGDIARRSGKWSEARMALDEAVALCRLRRSRAGVALCLAILAVLPGADADEALSALAEGGAGGDAPRLRLLLWRAVGDRAHLIEAKRLLDVRVAHAPPEFRESMVRNLRVHREIVEAATAAGL